MLDFLVITGLVMVFGGLLAGGYLAALIVYERFVVKSDKSIWDIINEVD